MNAMLLEFPHQAIGMSDMEWSGITSGAKRIIRDFYLNGRSIEETEKYDYYESDFSVRRVVKRYELQHRPPLVLHASDLCLN